MSYDLGNTYITTEQTCCPGWETPFVPISQLGLLRRDKRGTFRPGSGTQDK